MSQSTKDRIAEILGIQNNKNWDIFDDDEEAGLYLVHYNDEADLNEYGYLRGLVVDINEGYVICQSFGYTPNVTAAEIKPSPSSGLVELESDTGEKITCTPSEMVMKRGYEGVIIRAFKHKGKVYRSSHKKLDTSRSKWSNSKPFLDIYNDLKGPSEEQLFPSASESENSKWVHIFILVDPALLVATREDVGEGYIVFLESRPNRLPEKFSINQPNFLEVSTLPTTWGVRVAEVLSMDQANNHLINGLYDPLEEIPKDERLRMGEFLVSYIVNSETGNYKLVRIQSPSFAWRSYIRNNEPNMRLRFFQLADFSYVNNSASLPDILKFKEEFPILPLFNPEEIKKHIEEQGAIFVLPGVVTKEEESKMLRNRDNRLYMIWLSFLLSLPPQQQKSALGFYDSFLKDRDEFSAWIVKVYNDNTSDDSDYPPRMNQIIREAVKLTSESYDTAPVKGKYRPSFKQRVKDSITNFVSKEKGSSLYRLVKAMKDHDKNMERKKKKLEKENSPKLDPTKIHPASIEA